MPSTSRRSVVLTLLSLTLLLGASNAGAIVLDGQCRNIDPDPNPASRRPPEIVQRTEEHPVLLTFDDCTRWQLDCAEVEATLNRSADEVLFRDYAGELSFSQTGETARIDLTLREPVALPEQWDCLAFWVFGHIWQWSRMDLEPLDMDFLVTDGNGKQHALRFHGYYKGSIYHRDWFFMRVKLHEPLAGPCRFDGLRFTGKKVTLPDEVLKIYLGPIYAYQDVPEPLSFEPWPATLAFPTRPDGVLPTNKETAYENHTRVTDEAVYFDYRGGDGVLTWRIAREAYDLGHITVEHAGKVLRPCAGGGLQLSDENARWELLAAQRDGDAWVTRWRVQVGGVSKTITFRYRLRQKSLIVELEESVDAPGVVAAVTLGAATPANEARLWRVPFLNFDYHEAPRLLYAQGLFVFAQFDWYHSQASRLYAAETGVADGRAVFNGGARYTPKTDGRRNPVRERLYLNVSPDVQEVLPNVPNPPSPMKPMMGHRAWMVMNCDDYDCRRSIPYLFRALGMEQVAVRYHEGVWRDLGGSYSFVNTTAPLQGGDEACRRLVADIKNMGWLCGLYTNYTDIVTLNRFWNEDNLLLDENGDWLTSWFRSYSPKPMAAVEQQEMFAPVIHEKFGTNHCYCDVHTAVPPFQRVDYDARVPGAATFLRTYQCYGRILLGERVAHKGPVYSEGGNHWWYAGLVDGNYANAFPKLMEQPALVDFQLLKLHPLSMDAGNASADARERLAYSLAYGHIAYLVPHDAAGSMKLYYLLQPLQPFYSQVPVRSIRYHDGQGYVDSSAALVQGGIEKRRVHLGYENGAAVWVNLGQDDWQVTTPQGDFRLGPLGFVGLAPQGAAVTYSARPTVAADAGVIDSCRGPASYYLDTGQAYVTRDGLGGRGAAALKQEAANWELIPALDFSEFAFAPELVGLDGFDIDVEGVDEHGLPCARPEVRWSRGQVHVLRADKRAQKYHLTPKQGAAPPCLQAETLQVNAGATVVVTLPTTWTKAKVAADWEIDGQYRPAKLRRMGRALRVEAPAAWAATMDHIWLRVTADDQQRWIDFLPAGDDNTP